MRTGLISVIVPVYNVEKYIHQCVDSIIAQTYKNIEIILVDDGTKDNCGKICDEYARKDSRIHVIHKQNGGLSDARNVGILAAKGEFIGFVDSDDWIEPDMYELMHKACEINHTDICICGYFRDYKDRTFSNIVSKEKIYNSEKTLQELFRGVEIQDHAWTKLYRKYLWDDIKYPVGKVYEDIRTVYKVVRKASRVCLIQQPLYHYRQRIGSIARDGFTPKKMEWLDAVRELREDIEKDTNIFKNVLDERDLRVKCSLLRELFLYSDKEHFKKNRYIGVEFYKSVKNNKKWLLFEPSFTKAFKLMAILSYLPIDVTAAVFRSKPMKGYIITNYVYFT